MYKKIDELITLYNSNKGDELKKFDKQSQTNDTRFLEEQNHCEASKFAEVYDNLKGEIHKYATESARNKKAGIKEEIKKIIKSYTELKKSIVNSETENDKANTTDSSKTAKNTTNSETKNDKTSTTDSSETAKNKDDSKPKDINETAKKDPLNYYYDTINNKYKACPEQDYTITKYYINSNTYTNYYHSKTEKYLDAFDKFYTDSKCNTEINRNITKIYKENGEFKACADQGLTLSGTTKADAYTSLKALYYDNTNSEYFTQKNTALYTNSSCKELETISNDTDNTVDMDGVQ